MLSFIIGPSGYGKTDRIIYEIDRIINSGDTRKIHVIVPEQESVKMEAELLRRCGNRINVNVEVINFSRLANRVFREAGGMTYKYIDNAGKDLLTAVILENTKSACPSFAKTADDMGYVRLIRNEFDSLRMRGYHADDIEAVREKLIEQDKGGTSLAVKLSDFALLFASYEKALKEGATDTTDDILRLSQTLEEFDYFEDSYVFIDGFYDYTAPEYKVIERIMTSCLDVSITLSMSVADPDGVFRKTKQAYDTLRELAEKNFIEYKVEELTLNQRTEKPALLTLAQAVMTGEELSCDTTEGVSVTSVRTAYDECQYVAREIVKLVKSGVSFSEIAVCSSDINSYATTLENVLDSYGISHLSCVEKSVVKTPIISFALSALDVINSGFFSRAMRSYLKSPYLDLSEEEAYTLENYIAMWNVGKKNWFSQDDWRMNPRGYVEGYTPNDKKELEIVNRARRKVFAPLEKLNEGFADRSTVYQKTVSLMEFFHELSVPKKVEGCNEEMARAMGIADYDDEICAWNLLLSSFDMLVSSAGELNVGRDRYIKYLKLVLGDMNFGRIPSSLDEVELGNVEFVRSKNIKHMFFIGFNDGIFPASPQRRSVFTEGELQWLCDNQLKIDEYPSEKMQDQTFLFLLAVLRPSESLHFVYHTASSESSKAISSPSYFASYIFDTLNTPVAQFDIKNELPVVPEELLEYIVNENEDLSELFEGEYAGFYKEALTVREFAKKVTEPFVIESPEDFISSNYYMTQSRLEKFKKCRFSYFVEYMLKARTRKKAEFSRAEIGSYVHKILETVLREFSSKGIDLVTVDKETISEATMRAAADYVRAVAPNISEDSPKYKYLIDNICRFAIIVIENIRDEFSVSLFKPKLYEENMEKSEEVQPYELELSDGGKLTFYGVIDRVDSYVDENGVEYIRIVDYKTKTGGKVFSLEDVLNGMNLQMLIYLFAFMRYGSDVKRQVAGIMYMPAAKEEFKAENAEIDDEVLRENIDKKLKRSGMYLNDEKIINAMESGEIKRFIDLKYDKKMGEYSGSSASTLATLEEFGIIQRYIDMLFEDVLNELKSGNVEASPLEEPKKSDSIACTWCPYAPICRFEGEPRERKRSSTPLVQMKEELDGRV